ncbi:MAG: hypothetical protein WKF71_08820 [Pyrinomonadaceae bacterium]
MLALEGFITDITERKQAETESKAISEIIEGVTTTSNLDELLKLIHQTIKKVLYAENFLLRFTMRKARCSTCSISWINMILSRIPQK